jgi:hypothetical protein
LRAGAYNIELSGSTARPLTPSLCPPASFASGRTARMRKHESALRPKFGHEDRVSGSYHKRCASSAYGPSHLYLLFPDMCRWSCKTRRSDGKGCIVERRECWFASKRVVEVVDAGRFFATAA